ncbi:unnamed protein product (macronuclear) [Paramecium tetraurelia]|uniref:Uncharacterized protein n=1 Tax=Paramecium tetraurelia TaxID=5888 RepID=A0C490_PARTE|nr:uncharacterized protein GSPATT00035087001 [Paramecium tetraurelia]CAK65607.1 unnamed protein product [Paramecium tetraurelia]|eukprot:XP_001433004.1 hypothetical protein (macronuclear) [Paramecium tetraurelia strain d4-2]
MMMSPLGFANLYLLMGLSVSIIITTPCASVALADCNASGYCTLSADSLSCLSLPCYKINEVGACRDATAVAYDAALCSGLSQLDLRYDNVCGPLGQLDYAYVRLPIQKTGSATYSTTGMTVSQILAETVAATRNNLLTQLFSLNLYAASNTELNSILSLYIAYKDDMTGVTGFTMSHPYYMEKAIYAALQNFRDDTDAAKVLTTTLTNVWTLSDTLLLRLRTFRKFYSTSYFFVNFAHTQFSRTYLSVKAQYSVFSLKWKQYSSNGYVQLITFVPNQFSGFSAALSDAIMFNIIDTTGTAYVLTYTLTWLITDNTKITCAAETTSFLHVIDRNTLVESTPTVDIHTYCSISGTTRRCDIPSTVIDAQTPAGKAFYIACS